MDTPLPPGSGADYWAARRRRRRTVGFVFLGVTLAILVTFVVLVWYEAQAHPAGPYLFPWWGFFGIFFLLWIAFFAVRVAFWTTRGGGGGGGYRRAYGEGGPHQGAWQIARQRYARGEITREQYQQIMNDLRRGPGSP